MEDGSRGLRTTTTSLRIIELAKEVENLTLADVTDRVGVAKSTAHLHLTTLVDAGYLVKDGSVYRLGLKFFSLGEHARRRLGPHDEFASVISDLAAETREEAVLVAEDDDRLVSIYSVPHDRVSRDERTVGQYDYLHNSATGKAILAHLTDARVEAIVDRWGLPASTEHTMTSLETLREDLRATRERGYAISDQEFMEGMVGLAEPVRLPTGEVFGAVGVSGPTYRLTDADLRSSLVDAIARSAARVEDVLAAAYVE